MPIADTTTGAADVGSNVTISTVSFLTFLTMITVWCSLDTFARLQPSVYHLQQICKSAWPISCEIGQGDFPEVPVIVS